MCMNQARANGLCKRHNKFYQFPKEKTLQFTKEQLKTKLCEIVDMIYKD